MKNPYPPQFHVFRAFMAGLCFLLLGCNRGDVLTLSNHANAVAKLRRYASVNSMYQAERGHYAEDLAVLFHEGLIHEEFFNAWTGNPHPEPFNGYLFAEITRDADGGPLDPYNRKGLCAYPSEAGETGNKVFLILLSEEFMVVDRSHGNPEMTGGFAASGGSKLLEAPCEKVKGPVTRWPSDEELATVYKDRTLTPRQALRKMDAVFKGTAREGS